MNQIIDSVSNCKHRFKAAVNQKVKTLLGWNNAE